MLSAGVVMHVWSVCGMNAMLLAGALLHVNSPAISLSSNYQLGAVRVLLCVTGVSGFVLMQSGGLSCCLLKNSNRACTIFCLNITFKAFPHCRA